MAGSPRKRQRRQERMEAEEAYLTEHRKDIDEHSVEYLNAMRPPSSRVQLNPKCGAVLYRTRKFDPKNPNPSPTCQRMAGEGTAHPGIGQCKLHGGATPSGNKSAARQYGRAIVATIKFGGDLSLVNDATAEEALLEEVRRSVAMVRFLEDKIGQWSVQGPDELGGLPHLVAETSRGAAGMTDEQAWLILYREERQHMAKVAKLAIDAGIAERLVRIAEDQGQMLAMAIKAVLQALNLSPDQAAQVPQVVPAILRQVASGQSPMLAIAAAPATPSATLRA